MYDPLLTPFTPETAARYLGRWESYRELHPNALFTDFVMHEDYLYDVILTELGLTRASAQEMEETDPEAWEHQWQIIQRLYAYKMPFCQCMMCLDLREEAQKADRDG